MTEYTSVFEALENCDKSDEECQEIYKNLIKSPLTTDDFIYGINVPELGKLILCVKNSSDL